MKKKDGDIQKKLYPSRGGGQSLVRSSNVVKEGEKRVSRSAVCVGYGNCSEGCLWSVSCRMLLSDKHPKAEMAD